MWAFALFELDLMKCDVLLRSNSGAPLLCRTGVIQGGMVSQYSRLDTGWWVWPSHSHWHSYFAVHASTVWHPAMCWLDCMPPMGEAGLSAIMGLVKFELTLLSFSQSFLIWFCFGTFPSVADWSHFHRLLLLNFCPHIQWCCLPTPLCGCRDRLGNLIMLRKPEERMMRVTFSLSKEANKSLSDKLHLFFWCPKWKLFYSHVRFNGLSQGRCRSKVEKTL